MLQLTCKTCGAPLNVSLTKPLIVCDYCKTQYLVQELLTEQRISNIDAYNKLELLAYNAYCLHQYTDAYTLYCRLLKCGNVKTDIARFNICCLALELIKPCEELFESLECLGAEEKYNHIVYISKLAKDVFKNKIRENNALPLVQKIKLLYNLRKWYKPYKYMLDEVIPLQCSCGKLLNKGENACACGVKRSMLIKCKRNKKYAFNLIMLLIISGILFIGISSLFMG